MAMYRKEQTLKETKEVMVERGKKGRRRWGKWRQDGPARHFYNALLLFSFVSPIAIITIH